MGWKDTVMRRQAIANNYREGYYSISKALLPDSVRKVDGLSAVAKAQAEVSFKAGWQQGRKEVVEWIREHHPYVSFLPELETQLEVSE